MVLTKGFWHWGTSDPWSALPVAALENGTSENAHVKAGRRIPNSKTDGSSMWDTMHTCLGLAFLVSACDHTVGPSVST